MVISIDLFACLSFEEIPRACDARGKHARFFWVRASRCSAQRAKLSRVSKLLMTCKKWITYREYFDVKDGLIVCPQWSYSTVTSYLLRPLAFTAKVENVD